MGAVLLALVLLDPGLFAVPSKEIKKPGETTTESDTALTVAVLGAGVLFVLAGVLLGRISEVTLPGGAGLKLGEWAADATAAAGQVDEPDQSVNTLLELRLLLEQRLAWMAKHFVGPEGACSAT